MAKSEILMWVAGIMMMIILGLAVAPTITKSGDTAKIAVINSELGSIRKASILYVGINPTTGFNNINAELLAPYLPGMTLTGTGAIATLDSKSDSSIKYTIVVGADTTLARVTVNGLNNIVNAETNVKNAQSTQATTTTDTNTSDGILVFEFKG